MTDLISRTALLNECVECQKTDPHFEERGWASHFINDAGEPSTEWYCVEDMIENAPSVDAIPVGWISAYMNKTYGRVRAEIIREMLDAWTEQEAR